ncbi:MAG: hypothetical protein CL608_22580 [Anaerolineaceae bacterium]|nr:hypothetical protein [Anaerolineaceae bacterium]
MSEQEQLQQAISSLEEQRVILGDAVVDTTIAALQERLAQFDQATQNYHAVRTAQRKQVSILFANITGINTGTDSLPDTNILNIMNVLWRRLDSAITNQDGTIDKHMGEAVMGLFGAPVAHEDDAERALRAALQMRAALSDFVSERVGTDELTETELAHLRGLQIRIGINTGPVMLGRVGSGEEFTVIGDAVNVASRLEKSAPPGGILIAHDTYMLVHDRFNVEPLGLVNIRGRSEPIQVYLVLGIKPRLFYASGRGVEGVETRMVGRVAELQQLKDMLQQAVEDRVGQILTITGDAGVGKSRLVHEFNNWVRALPYEVPVFKGRTYQQISQLPFGLIRDILATYFEIQDNDPPAIAEEKLVQGMGQFIGQENDDIRMRANVIGQLIGLDLTTKVQSLGQTGEAPQLRAAAYEYLATFFEVIAAHNSAVLLFLEDLHWADEASLDFLRYLADSCSKAPLLIIGVTRPQDSQTGGGYRERPLPGKNIQIDNLSPDESQQLVVEILQKLPEIPADLSDLILQQAEGNPFYVEELIKVLIEDGVIIAGQDQWQLRRNQLTEVRVPPNITSVLQGRLDRLTNMERVTLQRAAVVGRVFWDTAVFQMNAAADEPLDPNQTRTALQALEKREMIFRRQSSGFAGTNAYLFKHAILHQITYESVLLRARPIYHKQVADWLAQQSGERISEYASTIAEHYELAEEKSTAAELYEMAAQRAEDTFNNEMATVYYCRSLALLTEMPHYAIWQLRLQEDLGELLLQQARLVEAAQTYMTMRFTAEEDGDLLLQARAWNGLAEIQEYQADYVSMLESAQQAERVSWLVNAESTWVRAMLHKSTALLHQGDLEMALLATYRALETAQRLDEPELLTLCLRQSCDQHIRIGRYRPVEQYLAQLKGQSALLDRLDNRPALALANRALGEINKRLGRFDKALHWLLAAMKIYRELEDQLAIGQTLNLLGETSRLRGQSGAAVPFYRKALAIVNGLDNQLEIMKVRTNLGAALVDLGSYDAAERSVRLVVQMVENFAKMAGWYDSPRVYIYQALAYLGKGQPELALRFANRAHRKAAMQESETALGFAWYGLACVLAQGGEGIRPLQIDNIAYTASDCFAESLRLYSTVNGGGVASARDQARTLWTWAAHEAAVGNKSQSERLSQHAQELADAQGIQLPEL